MNAKRVLAFWSLLALFSCNTLMEASDPYEQRKGVYTPTKNEKGETVYVRETPAPNYVSQPVIYPLLPVAPPPSQILPRYSPSTPERSSSTDLNTSGYQSANAFLEFARTSGNTHLGFHFGGAASEVFMGRLGGSIFYSEELYLGLDISGRAYIPVNSIQPFAGVGAYYGDTKKCSQGYTDSSGRYVERCEKKFLGAGYVELGVEVQNFSIFWRDYNVTRAGLTVPTEAFWGIGLRF